MKTCHLAHQKYLESKLPISIKQRISKLYFPVKLNKIVESIIKRHTFQDGIAKKRFTDPGVQKLFLLTLAKSFQENYENLSWSVLNEKKSSYKFLLTQYEAYSEHHQLLQLRFGIILFFTWSMMRSAYTWYNICYMLVIYFFYVSSPSPSPTRLDHLSN